MSFVSAEDNPTVNESTDDNVIENYNLTMLNEIDYISIGTVEKYPMSIINEKQSNYVSSPNNYTVEYYDCTFDGNITLKITIFNSMNGKIYFSFLNNTGIELINSTATYTLHNLEKGQYKYEIFYTGDKGNFTINNLFFRIFSFNSPLVSENNNVTMIYKDGTKFTTTLYDDLGHTVENKTIYLEINGVTYAKKTDNDGKVSLNLNLNPGKYEIITYFKGTTVRAGNLTKSNITILPTLNSEDLIKIYKNQSQFLVKAIDSKGEILINKTLIFNINGVYYNRTTNSSGIAKLNINLNPGKYIITTKNPNDGCTISNTITVLSSIISNDLIKVYKNNTQYLVKIVDGTNNTISNINVSMNINGVFYNRTTNSSGIAKLNINLNPGKYIITTKNPNDGCVISNIIEVTSYLFTQDLVKYYKNESKFISRLVDFNYNPVPNAEIVFSINGKNYTKFTDKNGFATLAINLYPGSYEIYTTCGEYKSKNNIEILTTLFDFNEKNLTIDYMKFEEYKVHILDGNGNPANNTPVNFNYANKDYVFFSDNNGDVTFKPERINQMNELTVEYNGYTLSNNVYFNLYPYYPANLINKTVYRI